MKMLLVGLVAVLFISGKCAFRVDLQDYGVEPSNEIQNVDSNEVLEESVDEVQSNSENESEELEVESIKRSKKSYNPFVPCELCGFKGNPYASRPSMEYSQPQYSPNVGYNNYNLHPKRAYHQPPPQFYAPHSYDPQSHAQPHYNYYNNNNKHPATVYPAPLNVYPNPHPHPDHRATASNLLIGCHPHVSSVPAFGYPPNYDISPYGPLPPPAPQHTHIPVTYRFNSNEDSVHSASRNPDKSNEVMPEKISLFDNSSSKSKTASSKEHSVSQSLSTTNYSENTEVNSKNEEKTQQPDNFKEAQLKQHDTLFKMAKIQEQLASRIASTVENQKPEPPIGKNDQVKKT